jgi:hypothetical protein
MDLQKTIQELHREKERLERAISALEELQGVLTGAAFKTKSRNGRKSQGRESSENVREDQAGDGK